MKRKVSRKSSTSLPKGIITPHPQQKGKFLEKVNPMVFRRTEELCSRLGTKSPCFAKYSLKSHVIVGSSFWMVLPKPFCKMYLRHQKDSYFSLFAENGKEYRAKYLAKCNSLSGGWRGFAIGENLSEGDGLVFQQLRRTKYKVYIIRKSNFEPKEETQETQVTNVTTNLPAEGMESVNVGANEAQATETFQFSSLPVVSQDEDQKVSVKLESAADGVNTADDYNPLSLQRPQTSNAGESISLETDKFFSDITNYEEFKAVINHLFEDGDFADGGLLEYYELCCSQNAFLHAHYISDGITAEDMKKFILAIVDIAGAIRTSKLSTFREGYPMWGQILKDYEAVGMNVSFIRARLQHLNSLAIEAEAVRSQYKEACRERELAESQVNRLEVSLARFQELTTRTATLEAHVVRAVEAEIENTEAMLADFGEVFSYYDAHIDSLKLEGENQELKFKEEATSPWPHFPDV